MKDKKVYYYTSLTDEVEPETIKEVLIDEKYKYESNNPFYKIAEFVYYNIVMRPIATGICIAKKVKWINKKLLKQEDSIKKMKLVPNTAVI